MPPDRRRLWIGIAIAIVGPIAITPLVRTEMFSVLPGVPYILAVVAATIFGRLLAATIATAVSVVLVDRYLVGGTAVFSSWTARDLTAIAIFVLVASFVAQLLVRLDRAVRADVEELDRLALLARAGDAVSGSLDVDETLRRLGGVLVPQLADWFSVDLVDGSGTIRNALVVHPDPTKLDTARKLQRRFPIDPAAPTGAPHVIRSGTSELIERITDEVLRASVADPELRRTIRTLGLRCAMVVPLTARDQTMGALTLIGADTHERYRESDLRLAEEIADRAALAIDTARLFDAESRARAAALADAQRTAALQDATAAFGRAKTVDELLTAMLEVGIRRAGAVAGTVGLVVDGDRVALVGTSGYELDDHPYWHSFGLNERLPMTEALRERRPILIATTAERDRRYPSLIGRGEQRDHALVCLPLMLGDVVIGGFSASYPPGTAFGEEDLSFLRALGEQCAQAIDRARSVEGEAATRARFDALAEASRALARTLDFDQTAATVVRLAVDNFGGIASLYSRERGRFTLLATASASGVTRSDQGTEPVDNPSVAAAIERAVHERLPHLLAPEDEGPEAEPPVLVLPLTIADSTPNALVVAEPTRDLHTPDELGFAAEVARRMARAMENARLYRERDSVARTLQQSLLPPEIPSVPGVEIEALFRPAMRGFEVGGDFYDVFETADGRWAAVIGDVCGKGVEAATLTGLARHTLRATRDVASPSDALAVLNRALLRERLDGRFITVAYAVVEPHHDGGVRVRLACGGHPLPLLIAADGRIVAVGRHGTLLGVTPEPRLHDTEVAMGPGASLVLFTDGILKRDEAPLDAPAGLVRALAGCGSAPAARIRERIERYVQGLAAGGQDDDIAVLLLRGA